MKDEKQEAKVPMVIGDRGVKIENIDDLWRVARMASASGLMPKGMDSPEKIAIAAMEGMGLGLGFMASVRSIAIIHNRPMLWGDAPLALVRKSGQLESIDESWTGEGKDRRAMCMVKRKGVAEPVSRSFTLDQAGKAGLLGKDSWKNYPDRMLQMRARSWALKDLFADVLMGAAIAEYNEESEPVITEVEEVKPQAPAADLEAAIGTPPQTMGEIIDDGLPVSTPPQTMGGGGSWTGTKPLSPEEPKTVTHDAETHEQIGANADDIIEQKNADQVKLVGPLKVFTPFEDSQFISKWKNLRSGYKQFVTDNADDFRKLSDKALEMARRKWARQCKGEAFPPDVHGDTNDAAMWPKSPQEGAMWRNVSDGKDYQYANGQWVEVLENGSTEPSANPDEIKGAALFDYPEAQELSGFAKRYPELYKQLIGQRDWTQTTLTQLRGLLDMLRKKLAEREDAPQKF